jgi:predicted SAM-dependent methyltransferase
VRLNVGCGSIQPDGWVNLDIADHGQRWVADMRDRLPWDDDTFDYAVANHSLSDLDHHELKPALKELRRVLTPGGVLRILVPDLIAAFAAYRRADFDWFPLGDDLPSIDERLCCFVGWFGTAKSQWTFSYACTLLHGAGFGAITQAGPHEATWLSPEGSEIATLDDREIQALIVEARK